MKPSKFVVSFITSIILLALTTLSSSTIASAGSDGQAQEEVTQVYTVEKMTCSTCPITVKTAIKRLEGVLSVEVDFDSETATVVFNPALVTVAKIATASTDIGFPATAVE